MSEPDLIWPWAPSVCNSGVKSWDRACIVRLLNACIHAQIWRPNFWLLYLKNKKCTEHIGLYKGALSHNHMDFLNIFYYVRMTNRMCLNSLQGGEPRLTPVSECFSFFYSHVPGTNKHIYWLEIGLVQYKQVKSFIGLVCARLMMRMDSKVTSRLQSCGRRCERQAFCPSLTAQASVSPGTEFRSVLIYVNAV